MDGERIQQKVNSRDVPLYGQVEAQLMLQSGDFLAEDAKFYVVLQGSRLTHVTAAKRGGDGLTLHFMVPGHDLAEVVLVTAYTSTEDHIHPCGAEGSLQYVSDVAQGAAEYLSANRDQLSPRSYLEVLKRFSMKTQGAEERTDCSEQEEDVQRQSPPDEAALIVLDEKITQAVANLDYPQQWKNAEDQPRGGTEAGAADLQPKETLLHLTVRLGLVHLSRFLIHQPRGQRALTLPNEDGDTPLQLAQKDGHHAMFRALTTPPGPAVGPAPGVWCVWSDSSSMLRFCPRTNSLTLTLRQAPEGSHQDAIMALRGRLEDHSSLKLISVLNPSSETDHDEKERHPSDKGKFALN